MKVLWGSVMVVVKQKMPERERGEEYGNAAQDIQDSHAAPSSLPVSPRSVA
jgi:hypothetical protein